MGVGMLGFLGGAAQTTLDSIEAREAADIELKKQKQLIKFREDLEQAAAMKKVVKSHTVKTEKGEYKTTTYNANGDPIATRDASMMDREERDATDKAGRYDEEDRTRKIRKEDQDFKFAGEDQGFQRRKMRLDEVQTAASVAASNRSNRGGGLDGSSKESGEDIDFDRAKELRYRYSSDVAAAMKAGISQRAVTAASVEFAKNSKTGSEMQQGFLTWLNRYRSPSTAMPAPEDKSNGW